MSRCRGSAPPPLSPRRFNWTPIETRPSITTPRCFQRVARVSAGHRHDFTRSHCGNLSREKTASATRRQPGRRPPRAFAFSLSSLVPSVRGLLFVIHSKTVMPRISPASIGDEMFLRTGGKRYLGIPPLRPFAVVRPFTSARYPSRGGPMIARRYERTRGAPGSSEAGHDRRSGKRGIRNLG